MKIWHHQIVEARTRQDLVIVAREYLASLTPQEWISVPRNCRPERIKGIDDLDFWHQRLADAYLDTAATSKTTDVHREMLALFTAAAKRAAEIFASAASTSQEDAVSNVNGGRSGEERRRRDRA